jgi:hypothetical protein
LLVLHGKDDDVIGYRKGTVVDGSPFQAVVDTVKGWAERRGCGGEGEPLAAPFFAAQKIECRDYCRRPEGRLQAAAEPGARAGNAAHNSNAAAAAGAAGAAAAGAKNVGGKNAGEEALNGSKNAAAPVAAPVAAAPVAAPVAAAQNAVVAAGAKNRESGSVPAGAAPMRACSVPGKKHNLYEVVRSFPIDVSAAWFAKQAGASWGPTPPS